MLHSTINSQVIVSHFHCVAKRDSQYVTQRRNNTSMLTHNHFLVYFN